jgi:hypothetical protein
MGIEPTAQAWEAWVLPLYDARYSLILIMSAGNLQTVLGRGAGGRTRRANLAGEIARPAVSRAPVINDAIGRP